MGTGRGTVNKVILIGRLGGDPELSYAPSGRAVVKFSLATNETWKDKDGNKVDKTFWHRIVGWGKLAEIMGEYLKKGSLVYIEGKLQTRDYEDSNGVKKWITEVVATDMTMLGSKGDNSQSAPANVDVPDAQEDDLPF
ncbi:single-stranded DNA-binding protein [candidate division KSB1 bacterium]|nr:MAG: single-stranded DNA-binding protein [candidate division KSB1 bacterium]